MKKERENRRIGLAFSGGVDSAISAALLKKQGLAVTGIFMRLNDLSLSSERRARKIAKILHLPFLVLDLRKEFKKKVIDRFLLDSRHGLTPNPCIVCNKEIKFGLFVKKAIALDFDSVATGHYARIKAGRLLAGRDKNKDQSYFLWQLPNKQLEKIIFPIGEYTRIEVEKLAKKFKLPFVGVKKSQEICFVPGEVEEFLSHYLKPKAGEIVNVEGEALGKHIGLPLYTIGQRKGIRLSGGPYYVLARDFKKNNLIVTKNEKDLFKKELFVEQVNWLTDKAPILPLKINAKIRYRQKAATAVIVKKLKTGKYKLIFSQAQRAVTPGQSVVFYRGQQVLGGGIISLNQRS
jgi:tRNA-specific 2-thiouridylase